MQHVPLAWPDRHCSKPRSSGATRQPGERSEAGRREHRKREARDHLVTACEADRQEVAPRASAVDDLYPSVLEFCAGRLVLGLAACDVVRSYSSSVITAEGAGIIATIIPIGLLIIGFEIRNVEPIYAASRSGTVMLWLLGALLLVSLWTGFSAEARLITAVAADEDIEGPSATLVWVALNLVGGMAFLVLAYSLTEKLGILDMVSRRAQRRLARSPRRLARTLDYIRAHHRTDRR